jgi:hypothetical protein
MIDRTRATEKRNLTTGTPSPRHARAWVALAAVAALLVETFYLPLHVLVEPHHLGEGDHHELSEIAAVHDHHDHVAHVAHDRNDARHEHPADHHPHSRFDHDRGALWRSEPGGLAIDLAAVEPRLEAVLEPACLRSSRSLPVLEPASSPPFSPQRARAPPLA